MSCRNCKYAQLENNNYCICKKKQTRVRISSSDNCKQWTNIVGLIDKNTIQKYMERIEKCK